MRTKYMVILIWVYLLGIVQIGSAQGKDEPSVTFSGKIAGTDLSMTKLFISYDMSFQYNLMTNIDPERPVVIDKNGKFNIKLSGSNDIKKMSLNISYGQGKYEQEEGFNVEPGDNISIQIDLSKDYPFYHFSGKGADKYTCWYQISQIFTKYAKTRSAICKTNGEISQWQITHVKQILDNYSESRKEMLTLLNQYKNKISTKAYDIMMVDIIAGNEEKLLSRSYVFRTLMRNNKVIPFSTLITLYKESYQDMPTFSSDMTRYSFLYTEYLLDKALINVIADRKESTSMSDYLPLIESKTSKEVVMEVPPSFKSVYNYIKQNITGYNRERTLVLLFSDGYPLAFPGFFSRLPAKTRYEYVKDALTYIQSPDVRYRVEQIAEKNRFGQYCLNYTLTDTSGKAFDLNKLKGKVVLVDFWFTGCGVCARFAREMKEQVYPLFKENTDFKVVSICFDSYQPGWMKSVESAKYSEKDAFNLYTSGEGVNHAITRFFKISGAPVAFLVDRNGKVVEDVAYLRRDYIVDLIRKELKQSVND